jgi:hypothetical protein
VTNNESTGSVLTTASASFAVVSQSYSVASGSFSTRVTTIESKYATTGSNIFTANQTICGNLTTTGTITAQTINVQQVTSSIVYSSGSNIFGCSLSNTQQFTGSVTITGSLAVTTTNAPELQVSATGVTIGNVVGDVHQVTGSLRITGSGNHWIQGGCVGIGTTSPFSKLEVNSGTGTAPTLKVYSSPSSYTANLTVGIIDLGSNAAGNDVPAFRLSGVSETLSSSANGYVTFSTRASGTITERMRITSAGITCFACQVCVGGELTVNGSSINVNCSNTGATDARINLYAKSATNGDRATIYGYNLAATTAGCEITYLAFGYCCTNNQGYINMQTKSGAAWCNTVSIINGSVGIGCTTPGQTLTIESSGVSMYVKSTSGTDSATYGNFQMYRGANKVGNGVGIALGLLNSAAVNTEYAYIGTLIESCTSTQECGAIGFYTTTAGNGRCERMRITSGGDLLVNRTASLATGTSTSKLVVAGAVNVGSGVGNASFGTKDDGGLGVYVGSGANAFQVWDDNQFSYPRFIVQRSGNVGIGTSSPSYPLMFGNNCTDAGTISSGGNLNATAYFGQGGLVVGTQSTTGHTGLFTNSASKDILFGGWNGSSNSERMRIKSNGDMYLTGRSTDGATYGMYFYSDDTESRIYSSNSSGVNKSIVLITAGTERMRITACGTIKTATSQAIGALDSSTTLANLGSCALNLNSAGGNGSIGIVAIGVLRTGTNCQAVRMWAQAHTQGSNVYSHLLGINDGGITITNNANGVETVTNCSGGTVNIAIRYINLTSFNALTELA